MLKKYLITLLSFTLLSTTLVADDNEEEVIVKKVVYDLKTNNLKKIERNLISGIVTHKNHYEGELQELEVIVVVHGDAYKFFMQDLNGTTYNLDKELAKKQKQLGIRLKSLVKNYAVEFYACETGVLSRDLNPKAFYPFIIMAPNATVALIDAQYDGFAYIPIW